MNIENLVSDLKNGKTVLVKNAQSSNVLTDLIIYYLEEEPDCEFSKRYKEEIGTEYRYELAFPLYLKLIRGLDVECQIDRYYTKIIPK